MKRRLSLLCLVGLMGLTVMLSACAPAIPHQTEGRRDCISCHGLAGVKPYPKWHAERAGGNDACVNCHKLSSDISS